MRKYRLLFIGSLLLGIMVIVLTGSRFWFEDGLLGSETLERLRSMDIHGSHFLCTFWCVIWPLQGFYSFCPIQCMDGLQ